MQKYLKIVVVALAIAAVGSVANAAYNTNLTVGSTGADVSALQSWLISKGFSIPAISSGAAMPGYFGSQTKAAVVAYQASVGLPNTGFFGPLTRGAVNGGGGVTVVLPPSACPVGYTCTANPGTTVPTTPTGPLKGGAGSVSEYSLVSDLNNEEVGEDEIDAKVAGLEIEADNDSDLEITAIKLVFDEGTAASDFDEYADEVSIWFDGKEVGRVDADEFNDDNSWTKTISLKSGAIVRAGDTEELVVAISGISNLDTNDATDTWTVDFRSVRFEDATGVSVSEDPSTATRTFSFQTFATAVNAELKIAEDDDNVNDAHVIDVHASDDTDNVKLSSFTLEAEGDSDLTIKKFGVNVDVTGATHADDIISTLSLWIDGVEIASAETFDESDGVDVGTDEDYRFDDLKYVVKAGKKVKAEIRAKLTSVADDLDEGDTIEVTLGETETDQATLVDVEDESGEQLVDGDITGSVSSGAHALYDNGINATFVSATAVDDNASNDTTTGDDPGKYTITFDVKAFGSDIYIDGDVLATSTSATIVSSADGILWATTTNTTTGFGTTTSLTVLESSSTESGDVTTAGSLSFQIKENQTRRFTLTIEIPAASDGSAGVRLRGINWATDSGDTHENLYTFDLGDFKTGVLNLNQQP